MIQVNPELLTKAKSLGINVKGTWGDKKVQEEIAKASETIGGQPADIISGVMKASADKIVSVAMTAVAGGTTQVAPDNEILHIEPAPGAAENMMLANKFASIEWANERAAKIWEGQSTFLTVADRVGRIRAALKTRGFTRFDELVLPTTENYKIYL